MSALVVLLLASPAFAGAAPKERIIWGAAGFTGRFTYGLYLANSDGKNERLLPAGTGPNYNPSFSADGQWIVFTSERYGSADLFRVHPDGAGLERLTDSPAFDDQGVLSPDGRTLAFVSSREGGTANIWLLDIVSHRVRNLTRNKAGNFRPSWSPNGKWIAFSSDRDTPRSRYVFPTGPAWELMQRTAVYIVHPDGSGLKRLTALDGCAGSPRWSSDSQRVVFVQVVDMEAMRHWKVLTQVVSIDLNTGGREIHSDGKGYAWAPAYVRNEIGYGLNDPGSQQGSSVVYTAAGQGPIGAENPSWSPDGSMVAYDKRAPIEEHRWVETRPSRDPRYELVSGSAFVQETVSFTRTGEQFVYRPPGIQQLKLVRWDGSGPILVDGSVDGRRIGRAAVSADGQTLAFGIWNSPHSEETGQLAVENTDGSHFRVVTHDAARADYPSFSPDGTHLVYQFGRFQERTHSQKGLRILSLADGKAIELTSGWDSTPAWSPRGDRIAFTGWGTGDFEIYTIRPDGTQLRQLTHTHGNDAHPVWSPDGKWIAFVSSRMGWKDEALLPGHGPQTYGEIFVMRADGTDVRQLTDNQWEEGTFAWAPPETETTKPEAADGKNRPRVVPTRPLGRWAGNPVTDRAAARH